MNYKEIIQKAFADDQDLLAIILYGSLAEGSGKPFTEESDIDIGILPKSKTIDKYSLFKKISNSVVSFNLVDFENFYKKILNKIKTN